MGTFGEVVQGGGLSMPTSPTFRIYVNDSLTHIRLFVTKLTFDLVIYSDPPTHFTHIPTLSLKYSIKMPIANVSSSQYLSNASFMAARSGSVISENCILA